MYLDVLINDSGEECRQEGQFGTLKSLIDVIDVIDTP